MSPASVYGWLKALLVEGIAGLRVEWRGGRPSKLTRTQKRRLVEVVRAGPEAAGFPTGCWTACLIQHLIQREFGVAYNVQYVADLLKQLGFSFQRARFVSDPLDEAQRLAWLTTTCPAWRRRAEEAGGLLLFGDEASFAQRDSLGSTWAPRGHQPVVQTTGKRKGYKVFGLIEFFSGRLFYQGIEGKFNGDSYRVFLATVLAQTTEPLFLVQDGAPYHRAAQVKEFFQAQADRLSVTQLPSYSPDFNPIEFLWRDQAPGDPQPLLPGVRRPGRLGRGGPRRLRRSAGPGQGPVHPLSRPPGRTERAGSAARRLVQEVS